MFNWFINLFKPIVNIIRTIASTIANISNQGQAVAMGGGTSQADMVSSYDPAQAARAAAAAKAAEEARKRAEIRRKQQSFELEMARRYGDDFLDKRSIHVLADARLRNTPSFLTGWRQSLYRSQRFEGPLYARFIAAGGSPAEYFAEANGSAQSENFAELSFLPGLVALRGIVALQDAILSCPEGWSPDSNGLCLNDSVAGETIRVLLSPLQAHAYQAEVSTNHESDLRALFLDPANLLNNPYLTNMSNKALAALVFSQVFVEEKWAKGNLNWIHPYYNRNDDPTLPQANFLPIDSGNINDKRYIASFYRTQLAFGSLLPLIIDMETAQGDTLTSGIGFGLGNQTLNMTSAAAEWYRNYSQHNLGVGSPTNLPTEYYNRPTLEDALRAANMMPPRNILADELSDMGLSPQDENFNNARSSQFWNVMRFVYAGAMQREGLPENSLYPEGAVDYSIPNVGGTSREDISAFSLYSFVYSGRGGLGANFANALPAIQDLINDPITREIYKAIHNIERLGVNSLEVNKIVGAQGLSESNLVTAYDAARQRSNTEADARLLLSNGQIQPGQHYDYLPYNADEAKILIEKLVEDAKRSGVQDSEYVLFQTKGDHEWEYSPLLLDAYRFYYGEDKLQSLLKEITR